MNDPQGFLKRGRQAVNGRPVRERVGDWGEVYAGQALLPVVTEQAGRCMDCGIPFCHSGCPLGNLIPEWNVYAANGSWESAADRLHATNNFPEFTGRLCPAPCEDACVLAINDDPVTIKNVEQAIADQAWERGYAAPQPPERLSGKTVAVIGSGPAGLAAAQQLTRGGHTVAVYERSDRLGGLLRYGIPEFKLEKSQVERRIAQMRAEGTVFRPGVDVGGDLDAGELQRRHDAVVVAVGVGQRRELPVPGRELAGIHQAMDYLTLANREREGDFPHSPVSAAGRHVVIIGGGDTASDCLGTVLRQGAASVVQLDIRPEPTAARAPGEPWPTYPAVYRISHAHEEARGRAGHDPRLFSAATLAFAGDPDGRVRALRLAEAAPHDRSPRAGTERELPAELVLLALGFSGPEHGEHGSGLAEQLGLELDARGNFARGPDFAAVPAGAGDSVEGGVRDGVREPARGGPEREDRDPGGGDGVRSDVPDGVREPARGGPEQEDGATGAPDGVFVAGDAGRGQSLIVWAIAEGRAAAAAVDRYLTGSTELPSPIAPTDRPLRV
ncbi:glutamate synthase subunit beta [Actinacidiphila acididurans]|uniref:Glutamate synthase subunit beta n=1 Tax=Actinacidiphila acididurans TaxID=2784346 RepID=A0ABS2TNJ1_9ACTN|nr:glutamate synthase subunit beta [Actinacidiphila acididurans]MBM9504571.1 glutamate synthase subunit beta [Actinacidiphila acididurans]